MSAPPVDRGRVAWLVLGVVALIGGTLLGWNAALLDAIATPPALVRAALVGASIVLAIALLRRAVLRIDASRAIPAGELETRDLAGLIRGVRYVFLAVAAFAAAAGWLLAHPLPFVVALVIAGVDILETTFLLLIVALRHDP
jgi:hypothetical protein